MAFQLSAGVNFSEINLATIIPAVASTDGAIAGVFRWGPVGQSVLIDTENSLASRFGKPTNLNPETFFTAASFLSYSNSLHVSRAANTVGESPFLASATIQSGNATVAVTSTTGLTAGVSYYILGVANSTGGPTSALRVGAPITVVNSTAVALSSNSDALSALTGASIQLITNTAFTAVANVGLIPTISAQIVKNEDDFSSKTNWDSNTIFAARYPGEIGNSIRVSVCGNSVGYSNTILLGSGTYGNTTTKIDFIVNSNTAVATLYTSDNTTIAAAAAALITDLNIGDYLQVGNSSIGYQNIHIANVGSANTTGSNSSYGFATVAIGFDNGFQLSSNLTFQGSNATSNSFVRFWEFFNIVDTAPGQSSYQTNFGNSSVNSDEMHIVVVDTGGKFTGVPGTVLEVYKNVSRATDSKTLDSTGNYFKNVINDASQYIYAINDVAGAASNTAINLTSSTVDVISYSFRLGSDGRDESNIAMSSLAAAYDIFGPESGEDVSLIMTGKSRDDSLGYQLGNYIIDNITEKRKDCVAFISPPKTKVVNNIGFEAASIVTFRGNLRSTSYAVLDSGYKYMYDRYNDINRWIPLNGDIAGLCARTDATNDAWWSPAGLNRGQIKNAIKLAYNPRHSDRDVLYKNGINPVVTFPGQGTVLYGDKTLLAKPSAFDRINVRRLFIVLEKAIVAASQFTLFEFNDQFTRSQFKNMVVPYLRDVQGRRGVTDFLVVCDETNNTPVVIDRNNFVGDIYIKPSRSINNIQLNFVATPTGVSFSEVQGQFGS